MFVVVQWLSHVRLFVTPQTAAHQAPMSFIICQSLLKFMSTELVMLSNHLIHCYPFSFCLPFFPALVSFPMSQFFASEWQTIGASASASVLQMNIQGCFPLGLIGLISLQSCPTPQFKSINYLVLSFLYDPPLTSIHDSWKNDSFDQVNICQQSNVYAF